MKPEKALEWIVNCLESRDIPYLICGGLAAMAYGAQRPLQDIDLYVPEKNFKAVSDFGHEYNMYGPARFINDHWNVEYVQFKYMGQKIEVGSSLNIKIFDSINHEWLQQHLDFNQFTEVTIFGILVRVMEKQLLIDYKRKLNRTVDKIDIEKIENFYH